MKKEGYLVEEAYEDEDDDRRGFVQVEAIQDSNKIIEKREKEKAEEEAKNFNYEKFYENKGEHK